MEKQCVFVTTLVTVTILTAAILFFIVYTASEDVCTSRQCVQTANELITTLNQSMDPCNDFYVFACGGLQRLLTQSEKKHVYDDEEYNFHQSKDSNKANAIRDMIEKPPNPYDTKTLSQIKTFYRSCTREANSTFEDEGGMTADRIKAIFRDIGGWPTLERGNWRENRFDWISAVLQLAKNGILEDVFIEINVDVNQYDTNKHILAIRMSKDYLESARINTEGDKKLFLEYLHEVFTFFGADRMRAERDSRDILEFLEQLKKIHQHQLNQASYMFNPRSVIQLQHDIPNISWLAYLNSLIRPNAELNADEFVNVPNLDELQRLVNLLNITPKKILANYLCWCIIQAHTPYFGHQERLHERLAKFPKFYPRRNRRELCARLIRNKMAQAVEASYVKQYITDDVKRTAKDVVDAVKKQLISIAEELDWLDEDAQRVAREKLASVREYVGHAPPDVPATWKSVYEHLEFAEEQFILNLRSLQIANSFIKYKQLRQEANKQEYSEIEYSVINNFLVLPSDYLQAFYVDETRPMYINFGVLGTLVAHRLAEVFLEGRRYDSHGELREWSTSQSLFNYDHKTSCLTKQYEQFDIPGLGLNINASQTQLDDIAVLFSKLIAYKSYISWVDSHMSEGRLPGLQFSTKQLFWIATAMDECHRVDSFTSQRPRSISKLRVVGPLRNSEDFAKDFRCPIDNYMNPGEKCALW